MAVWYDRYTYICIPCRFASKYAGHCPHCRSSLRGWYDLDTPKKRDDQGWKKLELAVLVRNSGIQLCTSTCCVPMSGRFPKGHFKPHSLTLSQFKARIRKQRLHHQGEVPKHYNYR